MKKLIVLLLLSILTTNLFATHFNFASPKIKESKLTVSGKHTMYAGATVTFLGGLLYLKSTSQKVPNSNTFTPRGASNRILSLGIMATGLATTTVGGILFGIGKSKDAIKHKRKVSYYISPLGQIGLVVKL
jgi:hypothetical protein